MMPPPVREYKVCKWGVTAKKQPAVRLGLLPVLTTNTTLRRLMTNEFHPAGRKDFDPTEPNGFIKRLTCAQLGVLNGPMTRKRRLTAFITFGDGCFDRLMGADYCHGPGRGPDNVRPNASLALFYKTDAAVELVFYTRFFVVSYDISNTAKTLCRAASVDKAAAFAAMAKMYTVKGPFSPVTSASPKRYALRINTISHEEVWLDNTLVSCIPYILLADSSGKTPDWFAAKVRTKTGEIRTVANTVHGTVNTKGCWMMLRNFVWNWPDEETGFADLARAYVGLRRDGTVPAALLTKVRNLLKKAPVLVPPQAERPGKILNDRFLWWWRNFTYLEFVQLFAGLPFDKHEKWTFSLPSGPMSRAGTKNCWTKQGRPTRGPNIFGDRPGSSWADLFLFKRTDRFTHDRGDTTEFA